MTTMLHTAFNTEWNIRRGRFLVKTDLNTLALGTARNMVARVDYDGDTYHQFRSEERARAFQNACFKLDVGAEFQRIVTENW
jgi:hypothetical protein